LGAQTQRSLVHFAIGSQTMPLAIIRALAMVDSAAAEVNRDLALLPAGVPRSPPPLASRIGCDDAARVAKAAHLNETSLWEEALASGLVSAGEFDALVRPEAVLAPDD